MNVDLPAPFGPATTTRPGAPAAAAARSDASGRTLTTSRDEGPALEAAARAAAVRGDLNHAVGIVWVSRIDRPAAGANPGLDRFALGIARDPCEHVVNLLRADVSWERAKLAHSPEGDARGALAPRAVDDAAHVGGRHAHPRAVAQALDLARVAARHHPQPVVDDRKPDRRADLRAVLSERGETHVALARQIARGHRPY